MSEWLDFEIIEHKPKTNVHAVIAKGSRDVLGTIKWYPAWRHYCFFPTMNTETVHSDRCLLAISQFITKLNEEHKKPAKKPSQEDAEGYLVSKLRDDPKNTTRRKSEDENTS